MELNKSAVQEQIERECVELGVMIVNHEKLIRDAVQKENGYELLFAKTWLGLLSGKSEDGTVVKMTVDDKKQKVVEVVADIKFEAELAEELSKSMAEAIKVKVEILGAHRSILSSLKSEEDNQPANEPEEIVPEQSVPEEESHLSIPSIPNWAK